MEEALAGRRDLSELPVQFLKAVSSMQIKGQIRQQSRSQEQVLGSSVVFANLLTSLHLIVMMAGVLSLSPNSCEVQLCTQ